MKSGELYKLFPFIRSGTIRTDDLSTDNMEYLSIGQDVPVMLLEENTSREYFGYWKVLVEDKVGWVHRTILTSHYWKING